MIKILLCVHCVQHLRFTKEHNSYIWIQTIQLWISSITTIYCCQLQDWFLSLSKNCTFIFQQLYAYISIENILFHIHQGLDIVYFLIKRTQQAFLLKSVYIGVQILLWIIYIIKMFWPNSTKSSVTYAYFYQCTYGSILT